MSILLLPPEILQQIVRHTLPEGFESLLLTSRAWYDAGIRYAPEYNTKKRRFGHFRFSSLQEGTGDWDDCTNATGYVIPTVEELMQTLAEEPELSRYIRYADFKTAPATASSYRGIDKETRAALRELVTSSKYLEEAKVDVAEFNHGLAYYQADWMMLFTLLPNVARLSLPPSWRCPAQGLNSPHDLGDPRGRFMWKVLDAIVRRANDPEAEGASLSILRDIDPMIPRGRMWNTSALESFVPFLAINTVRQACLVGIDGSDRPQLMRWPTLSRSLERLDLVSCEADHGQVYDLVSRLDGLRTLRFAFGSGAGYHMSEWNVSATLDHLSRLFTDQLEELALVLLRPVHHVMASTRSLMWRFRKLRHLELSLELMMGSYVDVRDDGRASHELRWQDDLPLREYLPASIETFHLHIRPGSLTHSTKREMQLRRLWQLFTTGTWEKEERGKTLPFLREVKVFAYGDLAESDPDVMQALDCAREWGATVVQDQVGLEWADFERPDGLGESVLEAYRKARDDYRPKTSW